MKKTLTTLALALCLGLFTGCTTTSTGQKVPDAAVLSLVSQEAAAVGVPLWLQSHPGDKDKFALARTSLKALIATGNGSAVDLQKALAGLPITELQGANGSVIVTSASVLVSQAGTQLVKLDSHQVWSYYVLPIATGLAAGLDQALGPE